MAWFDQINQGTNKSTPTTPSEWWKSIPGNEGSSGIPSGQRRTSGFDPMAGAIGVGKFWGELGATVLEYSAKSLSQLQDYVARHPVLTTLVAPGLSSIGNEGAKKLTDSLVQGAENLKSTPFLQPTQEYQNATLEQKLTTYFPETVLHLGANVAASWAPYILGGPVGAIIGAGTQGLSVAYDLKQYARDSGMPEWKSDILSLGPAVAVGLLDKVVPQELFGSSAVKNKFTKGFVTRLAGTALKESATEVLQEEITLAAELTVRDDLTFDEARERVVLNGVAGFFAGGVGKSVIEILNTTKRRMEAADNAPAPQDPLAMSPEEPIDVEPNPQQKAQEETTKKETAPISRIFAENGKGKEGQTLMERMRNRESFQRSIDSRTLEALNIGDPASPKIGSAFEVNGHLFVVRDVDIENGEVIGYRVPLDGTPTVSLETAPISSLGKIDASVESIQQAITVSKVPTGGPRSTQFVSNEDAVKNIQKYLRSGEDLSPRFQEKITTPDGGVAFGMYADGVISLINNPHETTVDHEMVHWYLDTQYGDNEKQAVYEAARQQSGESGMDDAATEEWVADRFVRYVRERSGVTGVIRAFFERALSFARRVFKGTSPDAVTQLFEDIRKKKRIEKKDINLDRTEEEIKRDATIRYQEAMDELPEKDAKILKEYGAIPTEQGQQDAIDTIVAYEVEKELGYIPKPNEFPAALAADLDYRRNLALNQIQQANLEEQVAKEQAALMLKEGLVFPDENMEAAYGRFKKEAKRKKWMLDPATDEATIKSNFGEQPVDNLFFPSLSEGSMTNDEMLDQYKNRFAVERDLLETMKKKTNVEIMADAKRLAERTVRDATIKKSERVKTKVLNINRRSDSEVTVSEMRLLQNRIRDMAKGAVSGFAEGKRFMKDDLIAKYRQKEADRLAVVDNLTEYLSQNLPTQQRGRFVKAIAKLNSPENAKIALGIMDQIDRVQENFAKRTAIAGFQEQVTRFRKGAASVAVDYQERILGILSSYEAKKPTAATLRQLNALAGFMEKSPEAYIPPGTASRLKRLARIPLADMTSSEIEEINSTVSELARLGRLKQDLKNVYDERVWQKNVDELIAGTVNRDPVEGKLKKGFDMVLGASDEISAPARVFDAMDGDKNYSGPNVRAYKQIRLGSHQADTVANDIAQTFVEGIGATKLAAVTKEQELVLVLHSALDQGNSPSVQHTMEINGMTELRALTEQEQKILDLAREVVGIQTDDVAAVFEEKHNKRFVKVKQNYLPFRYTDANPMSAEEFILDERMLKRSVEPGSVKERVENVRRELRGDFLNIIFQAIESQSTYIYLEPAMMNVSALVKSKEYREASGIHNSHYWSEYIDAVARNGASANALKMKWLDPFIRGVRYNVSAAILGGRLTTIIFQPFSLFHAYGIMSMKYGAGTANALMREVGKSFMPNSYYKGVVAQSPALTLRDGGDATVRELSDRLGASTSDSRFIKAKNKTIELALSMMKNLDIRTAASMNQATYRILRSRGVGESEARTEADFVTDLIASSSQIADRPLVYSRGEGVKMFTMFMSYAMNEWGIVSHDIVKTGLLKGDYQTKLRAAFALSMVFGSKMLEQVVRDALSDLFKKEEDERPLPSVGAMSVASIVGLVPFFGPAVTSIIQGFDPRILNNPVVSTAEDVYTGLGSAFRGKKEETRIKGWFKAAKGVSTLTGIPILPLILDWMKNNLVD